MPQVRRATGPGRVNLIGDHTDYNLGLALPMAIGLGVTVEFSPTDRPDLTVSSAAFGAAVELPPDISADPEALAAFEPAWARLVGAVAALARPTTGGTVHIDHDPSDRLGAGVERGHRSGAGRGLRRHRLARGGCPTLPRGRAPHRRPGRG